MATVVDRLNLYFKNLYLDYFEVFKDIRRSARARPIKASIYGLSTVFLLNLFRTNENLQSYSGEVVTALDRISTVSRELRNPVSSSFIERIGELHGHKQLRHLDLGFITLIYYKDCNPEVALYRYNCKYLNPTISEFVKYRVVDWGLMGHWFLLEFKMNDYDINEQEYEAQAANKTNNLTENSTNSL